MSASLTNIESRARSSTGERRWEQPSKRDLLRDFADSLWNHDYWFYSAWMEVMLKYRSTALGPIWIVAGTALFVTLLGAIFQRVTIETHPSYLAHLTSGLILWALISQFLTGSCRVYKSNAHMILNGKVRYSDYILKLFMVNFILFLHNVIVLIGVFIFTGATLSAAAWLVVITFPIMAAFLLGVASFLSVVGTRFPDLAELIQSIFRIAFFVTPIVWSPHVHGRNLGLFLYLNPFYYILEIVRAPLIDGRIPWLELAVVIAATPVAWLLAMHVYKRAKNYIPLWI
jgi:ABC-type polysaccharide/polyol phosphate export permease